MALPDSKMNIVFQLSNAIFGRAIESLLKQEGPRYWVDCIPDFSQAELNNQHEVKDQVFRYNGTYFGRQQGRGFHLVGSVPRPCLLKYPILLLKCLRKS